MNLAEYLNGPLGSDPTDSYNGVNYPTVLAIGWPMYPPTDEPGTLVSQPFVVEVKEGATPLNNVRVTFFMPAQEEGQLSLTANGANLATVQHVLTGTNGRAQVYFKHPSTSTPNAAMRTITAKVGSAVPSGNGPTVAVQAITQFNYTYPPNTVGRSASEAIDGRIAAALAVPTDPEVAKRIFSTQHHGTPQNPTPTYVRNTAAWCYHDLNNNSSGNLRQAMTCISPWNSDPGNPGHERGAGTAITAQHIILSAHYVFRLGTTVRFITADNVVVDRVVRGFAVHPDFIFQNYYPDLIVYTLETPLPSSITPCKVLPANYADYLSYLENGRPPVLILDQEEKALVYELRELGQSATDPNYAKFVRPGLHRDRLRFHETIINNDSGNPAFLILKPPNTGLETLVLLTTMTHGYGNEDGTFVTPQISRLNEMIVAADAVAAAQGYPVTGPSLTVQPINLSVSGFSTFTPP